MHKEEKNEWDPREKKRKKPNKMRGAIFEPLDAKKVEPIRKKW